MRNLTKTGARRFLILRFSSIGDIVLTTAVLEYLKQGVPDCELHFVTRSDYAPILEGHPHLSRIIRVERNASLSFLRQLSGELAELEYECFVDLHNSIRTKYLRWWLRNKPWVVYKKPRLNHLLLFRFHLNRFSDDYDVTSEFLKLLNRQAHNPSHFRPRLYVTDKEKERCRMLLRQHGVVGEFVTLVPGAAWETKTWPASRYSAVAESLLGKHKLPVVILGGRHDAVCDQIARTVRQAVNLKGKTDLRTALAILSCAQATVGGDTGLVHASEAVDTPVVLISGPTSRETGARVRSPASREVTADPWCRPCSKNGSRPCYRREQVCMTEVRPGDVLTSLRSVLAEA